MAELSIPARAPLPGLAARARLLMALVLAFAIAAIQGMDLLPFVAAGAALMVLTSPSRGEILRRLKVPVVLALAIMILMPLLSGTTPMARFGPLTLHAEGMQAGLLMATRLLAIVAITLTLLVPVSAFELVAALRSLRLPRVMADLAFLTLRYLGETTDELHRARLARRLRGGRSRLRDLPDHALLLATCLIRAQSRSERLWSAMRLRGYGSGAEPSPLPLHFRERAALAASLALAVVLVVLDRGA